MSIVCLIYVMILLPYLYFLYIILYFLYVLTNVYLQFDEEAEEISKNMDLNKVVLRFQAFHFDNSLNCYRPLTRPVDSEMVVNLSESTYLIISQNKDWN